ncbi:MAG: TrmB family transcriptional regulator [Cenarchaeum sp. SB0662_bin_33]|nr:TrmB family transcriptional regulator [Cenarchaeum sp. SB0662_bin_33]
MIFSDKTYKALTQVGLTASEIRAYSALLRTKEPTASELSREANIPYSKVYDVLSSLEEKGWVSSTNTRPTRYLPRSPSTGLDTTRQRRHSDFTKHQAVILNEIGPLYESSDSSEKPDILVLSGTAIETKMLEVANSCRSDVMIAIPETGKTLVPRAMPRLQELHNRGVNIRVLAPKGMNADFLKALSRVSTTVRIKADLFGGGIISDNRYVMILLGPEHVGAEASDTVAIWADHVGLAKFATMYFEYLFDGSEAI